MPGKEEETFHLREHLLLCQQMLDKGDVEGVKLYLGYKPGNEKYLVEGMPFSERVKLWVEATDGVFFLDDIYKAFGVNSPKGRNNVYKIIERLKKEGLIIKVGDRMGTYRKVTAPLEEMNWKDADTTPLELKWPLDIGTFFQAYRKNMGVIAGTKDAGKTAILLDFVEMNQDEYRIHFYTNEMGKEEFKMRISKHKRPNSKWDFHAYECTRNYEDQIARFPDDIHVIDYIEINDAFYQVGDHLKDIHEALGNGFVLAGLQKDWGARLGRGAAFSIQRPRLYITLERGYARVASAKNRVKDCERSPVGDILYYGIVNGWNVVTKGIWHPEMPGEIDEYLGIKKNVYGGYGYGERKEY